TGKRKTLRTSAQTMKAIATITPAATATPANESPQEETGMFDVINKSFSASLLLGTSEWTPCQRSLMVDPSLSQDQSGILRKGPSLSAGSPDPAFMGSVVREGDDVESEVSELSGSDSSRSGITPNSSAAV